FLLFHHVVTAPLRANLPEYFRRRLVPRDSDLSLSHPHTVLLVCLAIAIGATTHVIWDGFTHYHGIFVPSLPWLHHEVLGFGIYRYLQHGSTLVGLIALAWWFHRQ